MIARPKLYIDGELTLVASQAQDGVYLECEAVSPKSSEGRTVTIHFSPSTVDKMLLILRENAIERRRSVSL